MAARHMSWLGIVRLGLVQTALGAIVILTTSTLNRVMVVELALPAMLPGALVALHHGLQILRPGWGHGSDVGGHRTPWIIGGMALLMLGGIGAAAATALMSINLYAGVGLAILAFALVGVGVGATGTSLLALLATSVVPERRAAAATIVWLMMIAGFILTTVIAGALLDPYSPSRLLAVTSTISLVAFVVAVAAITGVEARVSSNVAPAPLEGRTRSANLKVALAEVWSEPQARFFTVFIFVSMLAYSMQDLILEPFAGLVFGLSPGETTKLSGVQNTGVFSGMVLVAVATNPRFGYGSLKNWTVGGCLASALALVAIVWSTTTLSAPHLKVSVFALGFSNGAYAVAAIGSMMALASQGHERREGMRMGIWGASQAISFGVGGFFGTVAADLLRGYVQEQVTAYSIVFVFEACLFVVAALLAIKTVAAQRTAPKPRSAQTSLDSLNPVSVKS